MMPVPKPRPRSFAMRHFVKYTSGVLIGHENYKRVYEERGLRLD
jgi:hypothetical protein